MREREVSVKPGLTGSGNVQSGTTGSRRGERGMTLIELLIGITVLAIGMGGVMVLFTTSLMSNNRSKSDTSGTMLAQTVLEKIAAQPANSAATFTVADCNPSGAVTWTIATAGAATPGAGATIDATSGGIDFTQAYSGVTANYKMQYVTCGGNGRQVTYDVRWNVTTITANSRMITVSARPLAMSAGNSKNAALLYAQPVTLRTIGGL